MKTASLSELLDQFKDDIDFKTEQATIDFLEQLSKTMEEKHISRNELAERLGASKAYVTKLLNGNANLPLKKLIAIAAAVECDLKITFSPVGRRQR